jgi:pimeloyl-ACP methyl ester carboxylesterase
VLVAAGRSILPDGRTLAYDDVGAAGGAPVLYLHGTPDSRLARHPDDGIAERCGVRLLAVDRPGAGDSALDPAASPTSLGRDVGTLLDDLDLRSVALLGWSSGGLAALGAASVLGERVAGVVLVCTMPPAEAYDDPAVVAALGPTRRPLVELAREVPAAELAAEVAPHLVPPGLTPTLALEHVLEGAGNVGRAELAAVPGSAERLAEGLVAGTAQGLRVVEQDLRHQLTPGLDLSAVVAPVRTLHGCDDGTSPPAVGRWLAAHLPRARTEEVGPMAGHHLLFPRWEAILRMAMSLSGGDRR